MDICYAAGYNATVMVSHNYWAGHAGHERLLAILVLLIFLAFALRIHNLDAFSFWTDEGLTPLRSGYGLAEILSNRITIQEGVTRDTHPPLYYLMLHFTQRVFGQSDFAYRYPSLLAGVLLVPLLYQFGRRLDSTAAGVIAALFTAVNPLQIYYSNEARMYTIFVLLCAAASYVLWRALNGADLRRSLILYFVLAGLAFYTHYTAVFLIALQALFWFWLLWQRGFRRQIAIVMALAVLVAIPVVPFTVPRFFSGAEASYTYVTPVVMLQDVLRFFSLGMTVDFNAAAIRLLLLATFLLAAVGFWVARLRLKRLFLLSYLLAVVLGLMGGSLLKPMYQGVRHIMAGSPALILLLAIGAAFLLSHARRSGRWRPVAQPAALIVAAVPLIGSALALNNLYYDQGYAKDDFRSMIEYIELRAGGQDIVLYNNAILLPLHEHYRMREDLPATALPVYPHDAHGVEDQLQALADSYERIWYVTDPPADERDAAGAVAAWLSTNLQDIDNRSFHARTTIVHSTGYRSTPGEVEQIAEGAEDLDIAWPGFPALRGLQLPQEMLSGGDTLWLDLFWQGGSAPNRDSTLRLWLRDNVGSDWAAFEQTIADNFNHWETDQLVRESYKLPLPASLPAGNYSLLAQPVDSSGLPSGEAMALSNLELAASGAPEQTSIRFANGVRLVEIDWYDESVHPGHNMTFALIWQADQMPASNLAADLRYEYDVVAPSGEIIRTAGGVLPSLGDLSGAPLRQVEAIYFPPETPQDRYRLRWRLLDGNELIPGRPVPGFWNRDEVLYGQVSVTPWPMITEPPLAEERVEAQFGPAIELVGYDMDGPEDDSVSVSLYWYAAGVPESSYLVFVHLIDPATGQIVSQSDHIPAADLRPTSGWRAGEYIVDPVKLVLPPDLPPGEYQLYAGLYEPESSVRLPLAAGGPAGEGDRIALARLILP